MTAHVALRNEPAVISHSERVDLFRGASCNIEREVLATLANGQDPHVSETNTGFSVRDVRLPSGDSYSGTLLGSTPEGSGRYTWSDGCIYDGEWRMGMRHGQGKTLWPSGATYEGEYAGGFIYGEGTYTGGYIAAPFLSRVRPSTAPPGVKGCLAEGFSTNLVKAPAQRKILAPPKFPVEVLVHAYLLCSAALRCSRS